jgi:putative redox protein
MKARIKWVEGVSFIAETGSGHAVVLDGAPEAGGRNIGARPMELVLAGTAACSAFDVVWILKKARQPIADCVVDAEAERAPADPKVFTRIHFVYRVAGRGLDARQVERAVALSKEKYCSATIMLAQTAEVTHEIVVVDADRLS